MFLALTKVSETVVRATPGASLGTTLSITSSVLSIFETQPAHLTLKACQTGIAGEMDPIKTRWLHKSTSSDLDPEGLGVYYSLKDHHVKEILFSLLSELYEK